MPNVAKWVQQYLDVIFVACVLAIMVVIFLPIPTQLLDLLLVVSVVISLLIMLTVVYVREPLEFSAFPAVLLVTTAYRLALNIASTRMILSKAATEGTEAAGKVIQAFGMFVSGNEALIGFILFIIITLVNFIVITRGSNRISEVAARFTLDAMPGKQMAIDADLNAGLIREDEARRRRERITKEADFYGAMDGATKFVRGDAIAGIIIILVNIIGGFIIGAFKHGMPLGKALQTYTILTVGDGLVSQIPALIVSISAGLIVTRATGQSNLGREFMGQVFSEKKALIISAVFLGMIGLVSVMAPSWLTLELLLAAGVLGGIYYFVHKSSEEQKKVEEQKKAAESRKPERVEGLLPLDPMEMEVGFGLVKLVLPAQGGVLLDKITKMRRQIAVEMGLVVPPIRIRDNHLLETSQYLVKIRGVKVGEGKVMPDYFLAVDLGTAAGPIEGGIATKDPVFGEQAYWVPEAIKQKAEAMGYRVVDASTVIVTHLTEIIKRNASDLVDREAVAGLVKTLRESHPTLVDELVGDSKAVPAGVLQKVLQNLLRERVSIRNLATILETLGDVRPKVKDDVEIMTEYVRNALARSICQQYLDREGRLFVITLEPKLEDLVRGATERTDRGSFINLPPQTISRVAQAIVRESERAQAAGHAAVVLCSPVVRPQVRHIVETVAPMLPVLSYNEITKDVRLESAGMVTLEEPASV